ncbi:MAG: 4-hydroxy-tetrahydrodipicolinate synthase [Xanthobacteraceae bacterium]
MFAIGLSVHKLAGFSPALPTPFNDDEYIDHAALERLCDRLVRHRAHALVVGGTTGEAPTLTRAEHIEIIRVARGVTHGSIPVIAGICANSTSDAVEMARDAESAGAAALQCVVPYYNKPTQAGMRAHFQAIAGATGLPIILYDAPSRCACGLADDTIVELAENERFIGLKDATGDIARVPRLRSRLGPQFRLLSGDDATALAYVSYGGNGCISVVANIAPGLCRDMYMACRHGQFAQAQRLEMTLAPLIAALFRESSPSPLKYALHLLGIMSSAVRLPLVEPTEQTKAEIATIVSHLCDHHGDEMVERTGVVSPGGFRAATG